MKTKKRKSRRKILCPSCGEILNIGILLGSIRSKKKRKASIANGRLGGLNNKYKIGINDIQKKSENKV